MNGDNFRKFEKIVSKDRLSRYRRPGDTDEDAYCKYLWNMCLCESLYPALNSLEVSVRNAVHNAMELRYGSMWFDSTHLKLDTYQLRTIQKAKDDLGKLPRPVSAGGIVAELGFGFWRSMFGRHMARDWVGLLKNAFPHAPSHCRNVKHIRATLEPLRQFRNRVFHHERILHCNPTFNHSEACAVIGWISPIKLRMLVSVDRFPSVYSYGLAEIRSKLDQL